MHYAWVPSHPHTDLIWDQRNESRVMFSQRWDRDLATEWRDPDSSDQPHGAADGTADGTVVYHRGAELKPAQTLPGSLRGHSDRSGRGQNSTL